MERNKESQGGTDDAGEFNERYNAGESESEEKDTSENASGENHLDFDMLITKGKKYLEENFGEIESGAALKYASMAVLAVCGIRKSGFLGSIIVSLAIGVLAKYLLEEKEKAAA